MRLLRQPDLGRKLGNRSESSIRNDVKARLLPPPIKYGDSTAVWPDHEIDAVIAARIAGKSDDELRSLVETLVRNRSGAFNEWQRAINDDHSVSLAAIAAR